MKIAIVGEAWGEQEAKAKQPFVGKSGQFLNIALKRVGIRREECLVTNVFNLQPKPTNSIENLCGPRDEGIEGMPYLAKGKYVRAEYASELDRLYDAGALQISTGIRNIRGTTYNSDFGKVLPTYHPAAIFRQWKLRPIFHADLVKAAREATYPEVVRPSRLIHIEPTVEDLHTFKQTYIDHDDTLSIDVETWADQITCFGIAPDAKHAIVVPFFTMAHEDRNYWRTIEEELEAWAWVREICSMPNAKLGQNFAYDMTRLYLAYGIACPGTEDTMLLHHALEPEMEKGLGFLGSIYTDEAAWKFMRHNETIKKED